MIMAIMRGCKANANNKGPARVRARGGDGSHESSTRCQHFGGGKLNISFITEQKESQSWF